MLQETLLNANRTGKPLPSKDLTRFNGGGVHHGGIGKRRLADGLSDA